MERADLEKILEAVKVMPLRPEDRVVLKMKETLSDEAREVVRGIAEALFPGHRIVVLDAGADLEVIRHDPGGLVDGRLVEAGDGVVSFDGVRMSTHLLESFAHPTPEGRWFRIVKADGVATVESRSVDALVQRFLGWKLPADFAPDGGVTFERSYNVPGDGGGVVTKQRLPDDPGRWPIGTNILNAEQARAMIMHLLAGEP